MNSVNLFRRKLANIRVVLMQAFQNTNGFTSPVQGDEREVVIRELLELVLPPTYRLGKGTIVDSKRRETGQVDAVFERPFSLSFPISSDANRLYLADNVAAAFEIKSDLYTQAEQAMAKAREIKRLKRTPSSDGIIRYDEIFIPTFLIGFKGHSQVESLYNKFIPDVRAADSINAILVIDSGTFLGRAPERYEHGAQVSKGGWYEIENNPEGALLMFFDCLSNTLRHRAYGEVDLLEFRKLLEN